ncbi:MAG: glycosyltransferase [Bacteroidales bacterium]|nr:glycosyltransferase [Candidatus Colimorpha onthohippi]
MRIVVAVTNDLVSDQRVSRTCQTLFEEGYAVLLVGRMLLDKTPIQRPYETCRMRLLFRRSALFYAEYNVRLFFKLLFSAWDMVYANDTDTLLGAFCAARLRRKKIFFDAHELFPEVPELVGRKRVKRIWQAIEKLLIPRVDGAVTVCQSISDIYRQKMGVEMGVVRNVPIIKQCVNQSEWPFQFKNPFIIYQGAVNVGRGVDWLIEAMRYLPQYHLVIAGVGDEYDTMRNMAASQIYSDRIHFLGRLVPDDLRLITPHALLGTCLLENRGLNYYYAFPNRIGDFVAAGIPVLATNFPEISKVVTQYGIGQLVTEERGEQLALKIQQTIAWWNGIPITQRQQRMCTAAADLDWNVDKNVLLNAVDKIMRQ